MTRPRAWLLVLLLCGSAASQLDGRRFRPHLWVKGLATTDAQSDVRAVSSEQTGCQNTTGSGSDGGNCNGSTFVDERLCKGGSDCDQFEYEEILCKTLNRLGDCIDATPTTTQSNTQAPSTSVGYVGMTNTSGCGSSTWQALTNIFISSNATFSESIETTQAATNATFSGSIETTLAATNATFSGSFHTTTTISELQAATNTTISDTATTSGSSYKTSTARFPTTTVPSGLTGCAPNSTKNNVSCSCNAGYVGDGLVQGSGCTQCPPGTYQRGIICVSCKVCDGHARKVGSCAAGSSADSITCSCNAGYTGDGIVNGTGCTQCNEGTYQSGQSCLACKVCGGNASKAGSCAAGSSSDSVVCSCNAGFIGDGTVKGSGCTQCPAGTYQTGSVCQNCSVCDPNAKQSGSCPAGSSANLVTCACNAGFIGDGLQSGFGCYQCPAGTYQVGGVCARCPANSLSPAGSFNFSACLCDAGYTMQGGLCVACPAGTYKAANGSSCTACPANSYSLAAAAQCACNAGFSGEFDSCSICPNGTYGPGGSVACIPCKTCDANAVPSGSCPVGSGADGTVCTCKLGYFGNGAVCIKQVIPYPSLVNMTPASLLCVKPNQVVNLVINNFPAFYLSDVSAAFQVAGTTTVIDASRYMRVTMTGNITSNVATVGITLPVAPSNANSGTALFSLSVLLGAEQVSFSFTNSFVPYVVGPPSVGFFTPQSVYEGTALSVYVQLSLLRPLTLGSDVQAKAGGKVLGSLAVSLVTSDLDGTNLLVNVGAVTGAQTLIVVLSFQDSDGNTVSTGNAISIQIRAKPSPVLLQDTLYPRKGAASDSQTVQVTAQYLSPSLTLSALQISMGSLTKGIVSLSPLSLSLSNSACTDSLCAMHMLTFLLPPSPDGPDLSRDVGLNVSVNGQLLGTLTYSYVSASTPTLVSVSPSQMTTSSTGASAVTVFTQNFPSGGCYAFSCQGDIGAMSVLFGSSSLMWSAADTGKLLAVTFTPAQTSAAGTVAVSLNATSTRLGRYSNLAFGFQVTTPPAVASPLDGSTVGGSLITITALGWGSVGARVSNPSDVFINVSSLSAQVVSVNGSQAGSGGAVIVVARTPVGAGLAGAVQGSLWPSQALDPTGSLVSSFSWTYYDPPSVVSISPASATVGGFTGSSDGNSIVLCVSNMPSLGSLNQLSVSFRVNGSSSSLQASVLSFRSSLGTTYITVSVPAIGGLANRSAVIDVKVSIAGYETRVATGGPFLFYVPTAVVQSMRYCRSCYPGQRCVVNGQCLGTEVPLVSRVPLNKPGVLVLTVQNAYNLTLGLGGSTADRPRLQLASNSIMDLWRASSLADSYGGFSTATLEFSVNASQCSSVMLLNSQQASVFISGLTCFDASVSVECHSATTGNVSACAGPAVAQDAQGFFFIARVVGPFVLGAGEVPVVAFGSKQSPVVTAVASGTNYIDLKVRTPSNLGQSASSADVVMVVSNADGSSSVSATWTFWKAPSIVSAVFDTYGTRVVVKFDQATNLGGSANMTCTGLISVSSLSLLASDTSTVQCVWTGSTQLVVVLGSGAALVPKGSLTVLGGVVQSANLLSPYMGETPVPVGMPANPLAPVISLIGPTVVDACSSMTLYASGVSIRPLQYQWSCSTDSSLDAYLRNLPPSSEVDFGVGTPQLAQAGMAYTISVKAVDFLGISSNVALLTVYKQSQPAPTVVFSPPSQSILRSQALTITGVAAFSACPIPRDPLVFSWRLVSGPALSASAQALVDAEDSPQLYLPANSLAAGATYQLVLRLQSATDASKFSEGTFTVTVGRQPVMAKIAGGGSIVRSVMSNWTLDASGSVDLDLANLPSSQQNLVFSWSCQYVAADGSSSPCADSEGNAWVPGTGPVLQVAAQSLPSTPDSSSYVFTVAAQDAAGLKAASYASVTAQVVGTITYEVQMSLNSDYFLRGTTVIVNSDDTLILTASCGAADESNLDYQWAISPAPVASLGSLSVFPAGLQDSTLIVTGGYGALTAGLAYTFTARCSKANVNGGVESWGESSASLLFNDVPLGGTCQVCLLGSSGCVKTGSPIVDTFRASCSNWADQDTPLLYRFGINRVGEDTVWTSFGSSSFIDLVLPSGTIEVYAQVEDAFGAATGIIDLTPQGSKLIVGNGGEGRRRLLAVSGIDWSAGVGKLGELVNKQGAKEINSMLAAMGMQLSLERQNGLLNQSTAVNLTDTLLSSSSKALGFSIKTADNVCESFGVVSTLAAAGDLSWSGVVSVVGILRGGLQDTTYITNLGGSCVSSGLQALRVGLDALKAAGGQGSGTGPLGSLLADRETVLRGLTTLYLSSATALSPALVVSDGMGSDLLARRDGRLFGSNVSVSVDMVRLGLGAGQAVVSLPASMSGVMSVLLNGSSEFNLRISVSDYSPASGALVARSPMVGVSLYPVSGANSWSVENLTEPVNITVPLQNMTSEAWGVFRQQAVCMFWDAGAGNLSTRGVRVVGVSRVSVVCETRHLSEFVVVQDTSVALPTTQTTGGGSTTTAAVGSTASSTSSRSSTSSMSSVSTSTDTSSRLPSTSAPTTTTVAPPAVSDADLASSAGNATFADALLRKPFAPMQISADVAASVFGKAIAAAGGAGVACKAAVPLVAVPGVLLETVVGVVYPAGFAIALSTWRASAGASSVPVVSAVTSFGEVRAGSGNLSRVLVNLSGLPLSSRRRASGCAAGTEWRYAPLGAAAASVVCQCPANVACQGATSCAVQPLAGQAWVVVQVNSSLCATTTPTPAAGSDDNGWKLGVGLGVGLGLGLGIPLLASLAWVFVRSRGKEHPHVSGDARMQPGDVFVEGTEAAGTGYAVEGTIEVVDPRAVAAGIGPSERGVEVSIEPQPDFLMTPPLLLQPDLLVSPPSPSVPMPSELDATGLVNDLVFLQAVDAPAASGRGQGARLPPASNTSPRVDKASWA